MHLLARGAFQEILYRAEDVKGHATAKFKRDLKLWRKYGPCPLWVIMGGRIQIVEGKA